jgi:hypothetical protein
MAEKKKAKKQKPIKSTNKIYNLVFKRIGSNMTLTKVFKTKKEVDAEAKIVKKNKALEFLEITETNIGGK